MQDTLFQDALDRSRYVRTVKVVGREVLCRVFFKDRKDRNELRFVGKALLPGKLFTPDKINLNYGFVPVEG